ncbi:nedd8-conjugating enzyme UBE2F [Coniosporium apollinis]|uniref:Nedd8-conjugating enzyme UBE2F n=1 Tax=Coniosporium apollinis TaxID=61459 RepID=A0ABQ9NHP8_9PEZI|nr:nedd8-conjugating enzyme UBE2F [Coniosporium apollinis]
MARPVPNAGSNTTLDELTISVRTEEGMVRVQYKPEDTILDLKLKLQELKGYPAERQQLCFPGEAVVDTRLIKEFARGTGPLYLNRVNVAPPAAVIQPRSTHSYSRIEGDESAQQYMGNIGVLPIGSSFGSHEYDNIRAKGRSLQVLGDMTSFPPGLGATQED